jgi:hypothetical protein
MRTRVARAALVAAVAVTAVLALVRDRASAGLDGEVYTSREANIRMAVPRGWRVSDLPSYPGVLLWMAHTKPPGMMLLTVDTIDRNVRCSWPATCRTAGRPLAEQMACGIAARLEKSGFKPGPIQSGRTPWFDYEDGKQWLRQAVLVAGTHGVTVILSAPSVTDRASHARAFDRAVRSLRALTASEAAAVAPAFDAAVADASSDDGGVVSDARPVETGDGGVPSVTAPSDAGVPDAGVPAVEAPGTGPLLEPCPETP